MENDMDKRQTAPDLQQEIEELLQQLRILQYQLAQQEALIAHYPEQLRLLRSP
jgi:hypothetical protein